MSEETAVATTQPKLSLVATMAHRFSMEPGNFLNVVKKTVFPQDREVGNEQVAAFLAVAQQYDLNPFTREIFAFPTKGGGIQPIVSIDGWIKLIVGHPQYNGMDLQLVVDKDGKPSSCSCTIYRKDREHPTPVIEYYDECFRNTEPWNKMPKRMLRHKAIKEAGRITFGFAGIADEDEAADAIRNITSESVEISRETNTKAEALKEKINSKKAFSAAKEKAEEVAAKSAPPVQQTPEPETTTVAPPTEELPPIDEDLYGPSVEDRVLTDQERFALVDAIKSAGATNPQAAQKAARQKFMEYGYPKASEIRLKDYQPIMEWAKNLKV
jgi:phage recombination protein Bet